MSRFLPSDDGPTAHSVKVGEETKKDLQRAAILLDLSQRAADENLVKEHLAGFVTAELERYEEGGLISWRERRRREDELAKSIVLWTPPEPKTARSGRTAADPLAVLGRLLGLGGKK